MLVVLIPLLMLVTICATVLIVHKRESLGPKAKALQAENTRLHRALREIDSMALAEYTVSGESSILAANIIRTVTDSRIKEIA